MVAPIELLPDNPAAELQYAIEDMLAGAIDTLICEAVELERVSRYVVTSNLDCGILVDGARAFEVTVTAPLEFNPSSGSMRWLDHATVTARWVGVFVHLNQLARQRAMCSSCGIEPGMGGHYHSAGERG